MEQGGEGKAGDSEMGIGLDQGYPPYPPVFSYEGETKGLRENGLHEGERKELGAILVKVW